MQKGKHWALVFMFTGKPLNSANACVWAKALAGAGAMMERYAHLAPDQLALAASRLDSLVAGYDLAK